MGSLKQILKLLKEQGINSFNLIPPIRARHIQTKPVFLFTVDDIWENTDNTSLSKLATILNKNNIKATFFITPYYHNVVLSQKKADQIADILKGHEFAQHGVYHVYNEDLSLIKEAKLFLEKRLKTRISGYRSPFFFRTKALFSELSDLGFKYNSDQFLFRPKPFIQKNIAIIPCHDKCDPFAMNLDDKNILILVKSKLEYSIKSRKPYVFLMHSQDLSDENLKILSEIFDEVKKDNLPSLFLGEFTEGIA
jgi:peptidoglycan/xylan/chitin deacetylase (PgdA/CDA1 family)